MGADPLPITGVDPALPGASFAVRTSSPYAYIPVRVGLAVPAGAQYREFIGEVSDRNVPGQDGSLANDYTVGFGVFGPSDAEPNTLRGNLSGLFMLRPGTYYVQFSAKRFLIGGSFEDGCFFGCLEVSPVYTIQTVAPAPATPPTTTPATPASAAASEQCRRARAELVIAQRRVVLQRGVVNRAKSKAARARAVKKLRAAAVARNRVQAAMWRACP